MARTGPKVSHSLLKQAEQDGCDAGGEHTEAANLVRGTRTNNKQTRRLGRPPPNST